MKNYKILLFQRIIPNYRVALFRHLYHELGIIVCHSKERKNGKIKSDMANINYPNELIGRFYYQKEEASVIQNVLEPLLKYRPKIVISQFSFKYMSFFLLFILKLIFRYKLIVWSHGIPNKERNNPFNTFRGKLSLFVYKHVDAIILYSDKIKELFINNGVTKTPVFVAQNTLDTKNFEKIYLKLKETNRDSLKRELGFNSTFNIIYIGRLLKSKKIDLLCRVFDIIKANCDISLHIVGDGPEQDFVVEQVKKNNRIVYHGAIYDENISSKLLYCSDILLITGEVGLSIIHGFAFGLPIITVAGPSHGPEIDYLIDGKNGFSVEQNEYVIAEKIEYLIDNKEKLIDLKKNAIETAYINCSTENFTKGFIETVNFFNI